MPWLIGIVGALALLALLIARKLTRDAIRQGGRRVGSALLARYVPPGAKEARFLVLRGEPGFQPDQPFRHQGRDFSIAWSEGYDDSSTVLRRWLGVTCRIDPR
jgi:hypothetical protein